MIFTKDVQNARYTYVKSETTLGECIKKLEHSLAHLLHTKKLYLQGVIKHYCYQSYKASSAKYRTNLVEQLKQAKIEKHQAWCAYDKIKLEFDKQNPKDTILQDALARLNHEQKQALKEYFLNTN